MIDEAKLRRGYRPFRHAPHLASIGFESLVERAKKRGWRKRGSVLLQEPDSREIVAIARVMAAPWRTPTVVPGRVEYPVVVDWQAADGYGSVPIVRRLWREVRSRYTAGGFWACESATWPELSGAVPVGFLGTGEIQLFGWSLLTVREPVGVWSIDGLEEVIG